MKIKTQVLKKFFLTHFFATKAKKVKGRQAERGFSLTELLVVVVIMAVLSAIAVPAYLSYRDNVLLLFQKVELTNIAKALHYAYSIDGSYHQKIWTAGYRPSKKMEVGAGLRYSRTAAICCSSYPQNNTGDFSRYFTLTKDVYDATKVDSAVKANEICSAGHCLFTTKPFSRGGVKDTTTLQHASCVVLAGKKSKCACDSFVASSEASRYQTSTKSFSKMFINQNNLLCVHKSANMLDLV